MTDSANLVSHTPVVSNAAREPARKYIGSGHAGCTCGKVLPRSVANVAHDSDRTLTSSSNELLALFAARAQNRKASLRTLIHEVRQLPSQEWNRRSSGQSYPKDEDRTMALPKMYPDIDRHVRGTSPSGHPSSVKKHTDQTPPPEPAEPVTVDDAVNPSLRQPTPRPTPDTAQSGQNNPTVPPFTFTPAQAPVKKLQENNAPENAKQLPTPDTAKKDKDETPEPVSPAFLQGPLQKQTLSEQDDSGNASDHEDDNKSHISQKSDSAVYEYSQNLDSEDDSDQENSWSASLTDLAATGLSTVYQAATTVLGGATSLLSFFPFKFLVRSTDEKTGAAYQP